MYAELLVTVILLLPLISPQRWHSFFKSNFLKSIKKMSGMYFKIFLGLLIMCFMDAIREMRKYSGSAEPHGHGSEHLDVEMQQHMRLFRAQRNYYISGFALVLCVVLHRLTTLISDLAVSQIEAAAALTQARSASAAADQILKDAPAQGAVEEAKREAQELVEELVKENDKLKAESKAALDQAEGVRREYDRLLEEHAGLQANTEKKDE